MRNIGKAKKEDVESILKLYKSQLGEPFCAWDDGYPCAENIADDLSRESLFIMKDGNGDILAAISSSKWRHCPRNDPFWNGRTAETREKEHSFSCKQSQPKGDTVLRTISFSCRRRMRIV